MVDEALFKIKFLQLKVAEALFKIKFWNKGGSGTVQNKVTKITFIYSEL